MDKNKIFKAKESALEDLIDTMDQLELEKMKGFRKRGDEKPVITAEKQQVSPKKAKLLKKKMKAMEEMDEECE